MNTPHNYIQGVRKQIFYGGHEEMKKVYLAKFQNFYYIHISNKDGGAQAPPVPHPLTIFDTL